MHHGAKVILVLATAATLSACSGQKQEEPAGEATSAAAATPAAPLDKPPAAFAQCMSCHTVEAGKNMIGPSLHGVVGRKAASLPGYAYSAALKASGLTWDEATLDTWLTAPAKLVPGTKMAFFGLPDAAKRKELIDYLARQK
ncbi:MAG: c-type cytochrome [Sphingomonadales bacterium]|nr:c-type cytochrome [Sphingomonadales bacterium]